MSSINSHRSEITLLAVVALLFGLCFVSCKTDMNDIRRLTLPDTIPGQYISNGELLFSEEGAVKVRLKSRTINSYESDERYIEMPDGFYAEFFNDSSEIESTITAEYGIFYDDKKQMEARKNVVVQSLKDSVTLTSEELIWDQNRHKIYSDVFVKITEPDRILLGDGFESEEDFSQRKIKKLRGEISLREEE